MAENAVGRVRLLGRTAEQRKRAAQQRRRDLRIGIRQLERAELYLVALYPLDFGDDGVGDALDDLIRDLRGLREHLVRARLTA